MQTVLLWKNHSSKCSIVMPQLLYCLCFGPPRDHKQYHSLGIIREPRCESCHYLSNPFSVYISGVIGSLLIITVNQMIAENRDKVSSFYMTCLAASDLVQNVMKIIQVFALKNTPAGQ